MPLDQLPDAIFSSLLRYINILLYSTSDNSLFQEAERLLHDLQDEHGSFLSVIVKPIVTELLRGLIHYLLNHIFTLMLILESQSPYANLPASLAILNRKKNHPLSRSVGIAAFYLCSVGGFRVFYRGLRAAIVYRIALVTVSTLLQTLGLRSPFLQPIARIIATVLLSELHLTWTHATISTVPVPWTRPHSQSTWRTLFLPSLIYATAQEAIHLLPENNISSTTAVPTPNNPITDPIATFSKLLITAIRLGLFFPPLIALTFVETSLLPRREVTIVPFMGGRGARMEELVSRRNIDDQRWGAYGLVRGSTRWWLCEMHVKSCLLQVGVEWLFG